jgi:methyl-accepting chemotaxis protein
MASTPDSSPRRVGLLGRLFLIVLAAFGVLLSVMGGVAVVATQQSTAILLPAQASTYVAILEAAFAALPRDARGLPTADSLRPLREQLRARRPELRFELVVDEGMLDGRVHTEIQRRAAAAIREAPARPYYEFVGPPDTGGLSYFVALNGDPAALLELDVPVTSLRQTSNELTIAAAGTFGGVMILIAIALFFALRRTTVRVTRLARSVAHLAASSDFATPIEADGGNDEISELGASVEALARLLRSTLATLQESSNKLATAGQGLTDSAAEQATLLAEHAQFIQEAVASAEEIRRTSETAAERAEAVLEAADRAGRLGQAGDAAVRGTLEALGGIREEVGEMGGRIAVLAERAQQISGITQSVKDLADSSNMLALNAAIEAVRSGEQGKGFALVAREMRSLADQSIRATERVREILDDITSAIRQVSAISDRGSQRIEAGLDQLARSGASLRDLAQVAGESSQSARVIAAAVRQQNVGIVQIARALADQGQLTRRTADGLARTRASAQVLQEVTSQVKHLLHGYRL